MVFLSSFTRHVHVAFSEEAVWLASSGVARPCLMVGHSLFTEFYL